MPPRGELELTYAELRRGMRRMDAAQRAQTPMTGFPPQQTTGQWQFAQFFGTTEFEFVQPPPDPRVITQPVPQETEPEMPERVVNKFLIGCDPEFVVMDATKLVNVAAVLPHDGEVGYDHGGDVIEIRPAPSRGSYRLVCRMQKILLESPRLETLTKFKWRAGAVVDRERGTGGKLTLGGHVHYDLAPRGAGGHAEEHNQRIAALDRATRYLEALDILPKVESEVRRVLGHRGDDNRVYGAWGAWRTAENVDGSLRTEYRTPASWLYSPHAAMLMLTAAKLALVAPGLALDALKLADVGWKNFSNFFDLYQHKDTNARRVVEKLLPLGVKGLRAEPDANIREAWTKLGM